MSEKIHTIEITRSGKDSVRTTSGTVSELREYFGYTLECGHSWNNKIKENPTTIKSLVTNVQKSYEEKEASCYTRTFIKLV
jgi:hypothetical protein